MKGSTLSGARNGGGGGGANPAAIPAVKIDMGLSAARRPAQPSVRMFKGHPHAAPPSAKTAGEAPRPPTRWDGVRWLPTRSARRAHRTGGRLTARAPREVAAAEVTRRRWRGCSCGAPRAGAAPADRREASCHYAPSERREGLATALSGLVWRRLLYRLRRLAWRRREPGGGARSSSRSTTVSARSAFRPSSDEGIATTRPHHGMMDAIAALHG
jgi:hypothetical protein